MIEPNNGLSDDYLDGLRPMLEEIVDAAITISGADFGNIQLLDPKSSDLRIVVQRGFPQWWVDYWNRVSAGHGACGTALERGERVIVEDVERSPIFLGTPALEIQRKAGVRAVQSTPIMTRAGKLLGMFSNHYKTPWQLDDRTLRLLDLLARQAADVMERAQIEEALRKFSRVIEQTASTVVITDPKGFIEYVNPRFSVTTGYTAEEAIGKRPSLLKSGYTTDEKYRELWRTITSGGDWHGEFQNCRKDRTLYWESAIISPIRDGRGEITHFVAIKDDITDRKRMEEALRKSVAFDETALKCLGEGLYTIDTQGLVTFMNPAAEELFGWSFAELRGKKMHDMTHHHYRDGRPFPSSECAGFQVLTHGRPLKNHEDVFIHKDGTFFDVIYTIAPMRDGDEITGLVVVFSDVSERKRAERALRERDARSQALIETAADGIWMLDGEGRFLAVNDAYIRRSGYSREELLTMSIADVEASESPEEVQAHIRKVLREGSDRFETVHRAKDGELWPVEVSASYSEESGHRFFGFLRDITERKRNEAILRESEQRYRTTLDNMLEGCQVIDFDWRYRYVNETAARHGRQSKEALRGRTLMECYPGIEETPLYARLKRCMSERVAANMENHFTFPGGGSGWFELSIQPVPEGLFILSVDITERKRAEEALAAVHRELEQVMQYQVASQTVAAIAHELNQPLTALSNYADLALDLLDEGNAQPEMLRRAVEGSAKQAERAGRVVRELLHYLRRGEIETEPVDINDVAQRILMKAEFNGSGEFRGRLELAPQLPQVMANRIQVEKVLGNLIQNGVEAMRGAGIDTRHVTVTVRTSADEGYVQLTVRDSGPGVDAETLHQIFHPFFTTKPRGLGMGLAISRAIIEAHRGQLWVESEPGSGAAFHLTLPFANEPG